MNKSSGKSTHFGFGQVPENAKTGLIKELFASVSDRYDLMNDIMSAGSHRIWKTAMVDWLAPQPGQKILDLAGGTGDIASRIANREPGAEVAVLDLTEKMLVKGKERVAAGKNSSAIDWIAGDAQAMPFPDRMFDACTIAFGIRNFTDILAGLGEIHRVLKIGGRILVLEFSEPANPGFRKLYDRYSFDVLPDLGQFVANDRESYQYLVESIRQFPDQNTFAGILADCGFSDVKFRNLAMGVASIHSGWKI